MVEALTSQHHRWAEQTLRVTNKIFLKYLEMRITIK